MRNIALVGASALVLALGVASASAQPTTDQLLNAGLAVAPSASTQVYEGRAAAIEGQTPATNAFVFHHAGR